MKHLLWVTLLAAVFALGLWIWIASVRDPFLDRAIPLPPANRDPVVLNQLEAIAPMIGKKVIFPPGLVDYLAQEKLINYNSPSFAVVADRMAIKNHPFTIREYLTESREVAGLNWKYDAAQDTVAFDFSWHQPVSHPARELVDHLGRLSPTPLKNLAANSTWNLDSWHLVLNLKPSQEGTSSALKLDPWRLALNELMSEPDNFPHAWKVRLADGCCSWGSFGNSIVFGDDGVFAHILKDADGQEHLLILNYHTPLTTPGPAPTIVYYLFAADGKWEDGGIFETGMPPTILFGSEQAIIEMTFKPLELTDSAGKVTTMDSSFRAGDAWYDVLEINQGKLVASLRKKMSPLSPDNFDGGITPLRHLGD